MRPVRIAGIGSYVPEKVLTNDDIAAMVETSDEWIRTRTGISERRMAAEGEVTSDLAERACRRALAEAGVAPPDVELIVAGTISPDTKQPPLVHPLAEKLGAERAAGMDVTAVCSGFVYALALASYQVACGLADVALAVGAETLTRITDWTDRSTCILFGDGAGAVVVVPGEGPRQVLGSILHADGNRWDMMTFMGGGSRHPASRRTVEERMHFIRMRGNEVFRMAIPLLAEHLQEVASAFGVEVDDFALVVFHQMNYRIMSMVASKLGLPEERLAVNIDRYGNTSGATIPIALDEARREKRLEEGDLVVLTGLGAGVTWGSNVIRW